MNNIIKYPNRYSEIDILLEFYNKLQLCSEYELRAEVKANKCRFDVVIYKNKVAICIVEIKNYKKRKTINTKSKQFNKYIKYNIPLIYILNKDEINQVVEYINKNILTF